MTGWILSLDSRKRQDTAHLGCSSSHETPTEQTERDSSLCWGTPLGMAAVETDTHI